MTAIDSRAKRILFATYWKNGWLPDHERRVAPADLAYAKSKGLMFDPLTVTHDDCVGRIRAAVAAIGDDVAGRAFVASLATRRLDWRSGLASYAVGQQLSDHPYTAAVSGHGYSGGAVVHTDHTCGVCRELGMIGAERYVDEDLNVLNFERLKWGGVRHDHIEYVLFDLERLRDSRIPEPSDEDVTILRRIVGTIGSSAADDGPGTLEKRLAPVLPSSKDERRQLIEILASARILRFGAVRPIRGRPDWSYVVHWRGADGVDHEALDRWFGPYLGQPG